MEEVVSNTCLKPQMAFCLMGVGITKFIAKIGGKASKAQQATMKFLVKGAKKGLKDIIGKKLYNKIDKSGESAKKKLQKQVAKLGLKKMLKSQFKIFSGAAAEMENIKSSAKKNKRKIRKLFTSKKLCTQSLSKTMATLKGYLGNPNV